MGVSKNNSTPKSSILIGFSIIFTIHFGVPLSLETPIWGAHVFSAIYGTSNSIHNDPFGGPSVTTSAGLADPTSTEPKAAGTLAEFGFGGIRGVSVGSLEQKTQQLKTLKTQTTTRWFQRFFFFFKSPRKLGKMNPFWRASFSNGLKLTTQLAC